MIRKSAKEYSVMIFLSTFSFVLLPYSGSFFYYFPNLEVSTSSCCFAL